MTETEVFTFFISMISYAIVLGTIVGIFLKVGS
jgi:hypothetical protein